MNKKILKISLIPLISSIVCVNAFAESMVVPSKIQAALFLKILSYDRKIKSNIKIGIINGGSKNDIEQSFESLQGQKISGYSFSVTTLSLSDLSSLKSKDVDILYVTPENKANINTIVKSSRSNGVLTITGVPEYVEQGVSVGIGVKSGKPEILVNLSSSKAEDRDLSAQLLKLCSIVN